MYIHGDDENGKWLAGSQETRRRRRGGGAAHREQLDFDLTMYVTVHVALQSSFRLARCARNSNMSLESYHVGSWHIFGLP